LSSCARHADPSCHVCVCCVARHSSRSGYRSCSSWCGSVWRACTASRPRASAKARRAVPLYSTKSDRQREAAADEQQSSEQQPSSPDRHSPAVVHGRRVVGSGAKTQQRAPFFSTPLPPRFGRAAPPRAVHSSCLPHALRHVHVHARSRTWCSGKQRVEAGCQPRVGRRLGQRRRPTADTGHGLAVSVCAATCALLLIAR
jgi:hypothetical protein